MPSSTAYDNVDGLAEDSLPLDISYHFALPLHAFAGIQHLYTQVFHPSHGM